MIWAWYTGAGHLHAPLYQYRLHLVMQSEYDQSIFKIGAVGLKLFALTGGACFANTDHVDAGNLVSSAGRWYISVQVEQEVDISPHPCKSEIGIDAGITCFAAFSDGTMVDGVHSFRKHQERLAREQRKLAHKKSHKLSTQISENQARVYVEKLQIKNMSASARGSAGHTYGHSAVMQMHRPGDEKYDYLDQSNLVQSA